MTFSGNWNGNNLVYGNASVSGTIGGIIASNAVLNWSGGDLEGALTVAQGGTLTISNMVTFDEVGLDTNNPALTNYGTVIWAGNIISEANYDNEGGTATIDNAGLWESVADNTMGLANGNCTGLFINTGTLEKTGGGGGTTTIGWNFLNNGGILGSQTNTLSLWGNYDLSGGTLNFGLNSITNYGIINLSGSPALTGSVSANLNNGYIPATGSSFPVLTYSSESGTFTNLISPFPVALGSSYGGTVFTLTVLNVRPTLAAIADQVVDELTLLTVNNSANDADSGQTLTFALVSAPGGMSINPGTGTISWTPAQTQSPSMNTILVSVTDNGTPPLSVTNSFNVVVKEVNVAPSLPTVSTQIVNELTLLTVNNTATNFNIHSTITGYHLVSPPAGMSISASGVITWTPSQMESPSTNTITTVVTNSNPYDTINPSLTSTNSFTVIVKEVNVAPALPVVPTQTVNELTLLTVNNTATESNIHSIITGYSLVNPPAGMSISAGGIITWTPSQMESPGTNTITTVVANSNPYDTIHPSLTSTNSFTVIVYAPTLAPIGNYTVNAGQTVAFTATATDNDSTRTLTFSLVSPPSGAGIGSSSGLFNWRLAAAQANSTNSVQVQVSDNSTPSLSDTKSFTVTVNPLAPVVLTPKGYTNGQFKFQVSGTTGPDYIITASTNLTAWSDIFTNLSPITPFQFTNTVTFTNRFYRVRLSP